MLNKGARCVNNFKLRTVKTINQEAPVPVLIVIRLRMFAWEARQEPKKTHNHLTCVMCVCIIAVSALRSIALAFKA
jgi:hypothetical protein